MLGDWILYEHAVWMFLKNNQMQHLESTAADNQGCKYILYSYQCKHIHNVDTTSMLTSTL